MNYVTFCYWEKKKKKQEMHSLSETAITWEEQSLGKSAWRESFGLAD